MKKLHYIQSLILAVGSGVFFALVVPLQTFLGNRGMFEFGVVDVLLEALPVALLMGVVLFGMLLLAERIGCGRILHLIVCAFLLCGYFEVGFFSMGLPPLDGEIRAFNNPFRKIIDSGLLILVASLVVLFYKWTKNWVHWIALAVVVMGVASLFDVRAPETASAQSSLSDGFCPQLDIVESARFSKDRNVIVLVLDSTPAVIVSKLLQDDADLRSRFPGFVSYDKNLAMAEMTARGLPGLMTGKYLQPDMSASVYTSSVFGPDSMIVPYAESGMPVFFSDQMLSYGYTNRRLGDFSKLGDGLRREGPVFFRNSNGMPYITLFDVVKFRLVPYVKKVQVLARAYAEATKLTVRKDIYREAFLYPLLASAPLSDERGTALSIFHTSGIHGPITMDRNGKRLPIPTQEVKAHYEYGVYLLGVLADFLDQLKKSGVYDNSYIIVCADHGLIVLRDGDGTKGHGAESSVLLVKRPKDRASLEFSALPTSNAKLCELVKALRTKDLERSEIDAILEMHNRKFMAKFGSTFFSFGKAIHFYEWTYDDDNNVTSCDCLGVFKAN